MLTVQYSLYLTLEKKNIVWREEEKVCYLLLE